MEKVALSLGSNLGQSALNLRAAIAKIEERAGTVVASSALYQTAPWGYGSENPFLNQVIVIATNHSAQIVLHDLQSIELDMGRIRSTDEYQDRVIDIDILLYAKGIISQEALTIPHPKMHLRRFCLVPLNEIAPNWIVPGFDKPVHALLKLCKDDSEVIRLPYVEI